jgi:hypothetical protein
VEIGGERFCDREASQDALAHLSTMYKGRRNEGTTAPVRLSQSPQTIQCIEYKVEERNSMIRECASSRQLDKQALLRRVLWQYQARILPLFIPDSFICMLRAHIFANCIARSCYHPRKCQLVRIVRLGHCRCSRYPKPSQVAQSSPAPNGCRTQQQDSQAIGTA